MHGIKPDSRDERMNTEMKLHLSRSKLEERRKPESGKRMDSRNFATAGSCYFSFSSIPNTFSLSTLHPSMVSAIFL